MTYPGGKNGSGVYQKIISMMPPHQVYIEAFLGSGAVLRNKLPAAVANIGIDLDTGALELCGTLLERDGMQSANYQLVWGDVLRYLGNWAANPRIGRDTLVYLDPPYLMSTRSSQREIYEYEMTEERHVELLRIIRELPCMVMISGYWSELYARALSPMAGWRAVSFSAQTRGGRGATEWVWCNFPEPFELHDYRYLGKDYRERERIKRKQGRWLGKLRKMTDVERFAMLSVIQGLAADNAGDGEGTR